MIIQRITEKKTIDLVLANPWFRDKTTDDAEYVWGKLNYEETYFLSPVYSGVMLGLIIFVPQNWVTYQEHICLFYEYRGKIAMKAQKLAEEYMWKMSRAKKLMAIIPVYNADAVGFAKRAGWELEGNIKKSFLRQGVLYDQKVFGLEK